jgi:hypothetical protein
MSQVKLSTYVIAIRLPEGLLYEDAIYMCGKQLQLASGIDRSIDRAAHELYSSHCGPMHAVAYQYFHGRYCVVAMPETMCRAM